MKATPLIKQRPLHRGQIEPLLRTANSPYHWGWLDKLGASSERAAGITALVELEGDLEDELGLQKQLLGLRRFPRKTTRTWRLTFNFIRAHYIREAKVVKKKIM